MFIDMRLCCTFMYKQDTTWRSMTPLCDVTRGVGWVGWGGVGWGGWGRCGCGARCHIDFMPTQLTLDNVHLHHFP